MQEGKLSYNKAIIHYYRLGKGPQPIIALHGFGESGLTFNCWKDTLPEQYTLYAIDLPLHGQSTWPSDELFTVDLLRELIDQLLGSDTIFILCGYSMGGRLALSFYQHHSTRIRQLLLLAPDGLKVNFWYWLATQTILGNRLFHYTIYHSHWFTSIIHLGGRLGLLNKGIVKYVERYLSNTTNCRRLYHIWTIMRSFRPNRQTIQQHILQHHTPVNLVYGQFDHIIQVSQGQRFQRPITNHCTVTALHAGHQLLQPALAPAILQLLS